MGKHLVLGAGPVGLATAAALASAGRAALVVSRHRPAALPPGVEHRALDVLDRPALRAAAAGSAVVYQCLNAPYHRWAQELPPRQAAAVDAARQAGARLVSFENLYPYGAPGPAPFAESAPFAPCSGKGAVRAAMARELEALHRSGALEVAFVRASDLFGPTMRQSALGEELIGRALAGKAPRLLGDPDAPHTWTYVPDTGAALARVGTGAGTWGRAWHVPSAPPVPQREVVARLGQLLGRPLVGQVTPPLVLRVAGLFRPEAGALVEMLYEFARPFVMADGAARAELGLGHTPFEEALERTVRGWRR